MGDRRYDVAPLDESTWPAFAALVEANNGIFGGCWCIGFHPEGCRDTPAVNRDRKLERVLDGSTHAASSSRVTSASAGASSERLRSCRGSRIGWPTRRTCPTSSTERSPPTSSWGSPATARSGSIGGSSRSESVPAHRLAPGAPSSRGPPDPSRTFRRPDRSGVDGSTRERAGTVVALRARRIEPGERERARDRASSDDAAQSQTHRSSR